MERCFPVGERICAFRVTPQASRRSGAGTERRYILSYGKARLPVFRARHAARRETRRSFSSDEMDVPGQGTDGDDPKRDRAGRAEGAAEKGMAGALLPPGARSRRHLVFHFPNRAKARTECHVRAGRWPPHLHKLDGGEDSRARAIFLCIPSHRTALRREAAEEIENALQ